jgi:hypothetical protein
MLFVIDRHAGPTLLVALPAHREAGADWKLAKKNVSRAHSSRFI